ncbi:hypothetical protein MLD38_039844 [Melastoma candidum]|uniref:Uncharacterized protein n=1 Tax=Melastoma candidum TaxID=119954 RepID=A0ACB9L4J6_9MYRT|nr:hypothetical protein MLD38_039844 [Melastoma candidum]
MLLSLSLQVVLIFAAPLRKKPTYTPLIFHVWLAYLLADWVAAFTVGLIAKTQYGETDEYNEDTDLSKCTKVIKHAVYFFQIYKGFIVDLIFSFQDRSQSQSLFKKNKDTFKMIAVKPNLRYDMLYTKVVIFNSAWAYVFRIVAFMDVVMATEFFRCVNKDQFHPPDV